MNMNGEVNEMEAAKENIQFSSQISEKIWGHRFKDGQRGPEYTLEFLNIMAGTEYEFGNKYYARKKMEEFRKFVFEGSKEGAKTKDDSSNYVEFDEKRKKDIIDDLGIDSSELEDLQSFFKNLTVQMTTSSGKMLNRSWYATMLFPLHESLLYFELRTNKQSKKTAFERNFFARGGELYYLMITYGTENDIELRKKIESRLKSIMRQNKSITGVVDRICENLGDDYKIDLKHPQNPATLIKDPSLEGIIPNYKTREYPKLPDNNLEIYHHFAVELNALLQLDIDLYELFGLLTSLICFQLHRYMLYQAEKESEQQNIYFIDCLDGQDSHVKRLAQDSHSKHETSIQKRFDAYTEVRLSKLLPEETAVEKLREWKEKAGQSQAKKEEDRYEEFLKQIEYKSVHGTKKKALIQAIQNPDEQQAIKMLKLKIIEFSRDELAKKQLPITRTLARDGGFITTGPGVRARYVLSDQFLCSLVYATLEQAEKMDFHDFMVELYERYNIVIGTEEAKRSGLYEREGVNLRSFENNEKKLRQKLKQNGLLQEYSDATALIRNPYMAKEGGVY
ncbi:hypothetical protein ACTQ5K_08770 [Niallia sp. Sow4_A1]|uniref:hypothetical protein n=1 Tax=unclassified Niallia TaxID=2837522 RepID=UPI0020416938|nr:hypothetical protein [Niallia sp. MER TA 168]MCM3364225.1 hypothetical protein [Niallia sp. MER TA 168]